MIFVGNVAYALIFGEDEEAPERQQYRTIGLRRVVRAQRLGICMDKQVVDARHKFARKRYAREYLWQPDTEIETVIRKAIFGQVETGRS